MNAPRIMVLAPQQKTFSKTSFLSSAIHFFRDLAQKNQIVPSFASQEQSDTELFALARQVDGIITLSIGHDLFLAELAQFKPTVVVDHEPLSAHADSITFDNVAAGQELGALIAKLGHRDVLYVSRFARDLKAIRGADPFVESQPSIDRRTGLAAALAGSDTALWGLLPHFSTNTGDAASAKRELLSRLKRIVSQSKKTPDCIVTVDASMSEDVLEMLMELKLQVPKDVSMADFEIYPPYENTKKKYLLSTMRIDISQLGVKSWKVLSQRLESGMSSPLQRIRIKCAYLDRGTLKKRS
jgi:DNA-binding LacI/PurR family transcriptional regulator